MSLPTHGGSVVGHRNRMMEIEFFSLAFVQEGHEEPYIKMGITAISLQLGWTTDLQNICDERLPQKSRTKIIIRALVKKDTAMIRQVKTY